MSHLKVTQAGLVSLLTAIVGQLVAFVPAFAPDKQVLISAGSSIIAAAFLGANAVHHLADTNVSPKDVEAGAIAAARDYVSAINLNGLVQDAVSAKSLPDLEAIAEAKARQVLASLLGQAAQAPAPVVKAQPGNVTPIGGGSTPPASA